MPVSSVTCVLNNAPSRAPTPYKMRRDICLECVHGRTHQDSMLWKCLLYVLKICVGKRNRSCASAARVNVHSSMPPTSNVRALVRAVAAFAAPLNVHVHQPPATEEDWSVAPARNANVTASVVRQHAGSTHTIAAVSTRTLAHDALRVQNMARAAPSSP